MTLFVALAQVVEYVLRGDRLDVGSGGVGLGRRVSDGHDEVAERERWLPPSGSSPDRRLVTSRVPSVLDGGKLQLSPMAGSH